MLRIKKNKKNLITNSIALLTLEYQHLVDDSSVLLIPQIIRFSSALTREEEKLKYSAYSLASFSAFASIAVLE